ncbi:MAG: DUF488 domain-containing protein [Candidatus Nitrosocosmicus sp.]
MTKPIITKSLKETSDKSADGLRILIARFRPRYLPKDKENWDLWCKELAPCRDLWKDYIKDKKIDWTEYSRRYIEEIKSNPQAIQLLQTLAFFVNDKEDRKLQEHQPSQQLMYDLIQKHDTVTLLCHCKDEKFCHRSIVKDIIYSELIFNYN